jgi:hypothetical protein
VQPDDTADGISAGRNFDTFREVHFAAPLTRAAQFNASGDKNCVSGG